MEGELGKEKGGGGRGMVEGREGKAESERRGGRRKGRGEVEMGEWERGKEWSIR